MRDLPYFQVLLKVSAVRGTPLSASLEAYRTYPLLTDIANSAAFDFEAQPPADDVTVYRRRSDASPLRSQPNADAWVAKKPQ